MRGLRASVCETLEDTSYDHPDEQWKHLRCRGSGESHHGEHFHGNASEGNMHMRPELPQTRGLKGSQPRALKTRFRTKESTPITGTPQPNAAAEVIKERHAASGRVPRRRALCHRTPRPRRPGRHERTRHLGEVGRRERTCVRGGAPPEQRVPSLHPRPPPRPASAGPRASAVTSLETPATQDPGEAHT